MIIITVSVSVVQKTNRAPQEGAKLLNVLQKVLGDKLTSTPKQQNMLSVNKPHTNKQTDKMLFLIVTGKRS